eukprot:350447-Chlamydomonas_euryale.AAC.3
MSQHPHTCYTTLVNHHTREPPNKSAPGFARFFLLLLTLCCPHARPTPGAHPAGRPRLHTLLPVTGGQPVPRLWRRQA